jgi:undecaprenyl-diphosphatase
MPSDTAMMAGALVAAVWAASRPLGWLSLGWGALFVCFPRVYFGLHYVSDVVVGAALGAALMVFALRVPLPASALGWLPRLDAHRPRVVVLGLFVLGWQVIESFWTARQLVAGVGKAARIISSGAG